MNVHDRTRYLASTAMDFDLTGGERAELFEHLNGCSACRSVRASYRSQLALASATPVKAASVRLRLRVGEAMAASTPLRATVLGGRVPLGLVLAILLLALMLVIASTVGQRQQGIPPPGGPPPFGVISRTIPVDGGWQSDQNCNTQRTGCHDGITFRFGSIWATSRSQIDRIDPAANAVVASIPVGANPYPMAEGGGELWVGSYSAGTVEGISPATNRRIATTKVGGEPTDLAFGFGSVWSVENRPRVDRIDPTTHRVVATIALPQDPTASVSNRAVAVDVGASAVWVATQGSRGGTVWRIDPATNQAEEWVVLPASTIDRGARIVSSAEDVGLWIQDDTAYRLVSTTRKSIVRSIPAWCGDWVFDADSFVTACNDPREVRRFDPATGNVLTEMTIPLRPDPPAYNYWETSIATGDGSVWVRSYDNNAVLRIAPVAP